MFLLRYVAQGAASQVVRCAYAQHPSFDQFCPSPDFVLQRGLATGIQGKQVDACMRNWWWNTCGKSFSRAWSAQPAQVEGALHTGLYFKTHT